METHRGGRRLCPEPRLTTLTTVHRTRRDVPTCSTRPPGAYPGLPGLLNYTVYNSEVDLSPWQFGSGRTQWVRVVPAALCPVPRAALSHRTEDMTPRMIRRTCRMCSGSDDAPLSGVRCLCAMQSASRSPKGASPQRHIIYIYTSRHQYPIHILLILLF